MVMMRVIGHSKESQRTFRI